MIRTLCLALLGACLASTVRADDALLPPEIPWEGASLRFMADPGDPWVTPAEKTGLKATPRYEETLTWLRRLVAAAPQLSLLSVGRSLAGRDVGMVVASREGASTPRALRASGKPLLLAHGGIHAGEIDGKDAGLMFLRDLTVGGRYGRLLDRANLLFIPILNVDGHERFSAYGRVNQRGPEEMGWRTNGRNLNLNRDFAKLDTEEVRSLVTVIETWEPDLYLDLHVTDGADYRYDITFGFTGGAGYSPAGAGWLETVLKPALHRALEAEGHIPGPLVFLRDGRDPAQGNLDWTAGPRFSNGYGDARHLPTVLVENHSLKPYRQRVLGTYVLLVSSMETLGAQGEALRRATREDRKRRRDPLPLSFELSGDPPEMVEFLGVESRVSLSPVSGALKQEWTGRPATQEIPFLRIDQPDAVASRPEAYWIPPHWPEVIRRLEIHGIATERTERPVTVEVEMLRFGEPDFAAAPFEGRLRVSAATTRELRRQEFPPGSVRVSTDQELGDLAMLLLEPASPDSFFQWGFFLEVLQRTEYMEAYVTEPMAARMLARDEGLAAEFRQRLQSDPAFAGDPRARLEFFFERTPYWDQRWRLYPVGRELSQDGGEDE